jgi:hypothetical protein
MSVHHVLKLSKSHAGLGKDRRERPAFRKSDSAFCKGINGRLTFLSRTMEAAR